MIHLQESCGVTRHQPSRERPNDDVAHRSCPRLHADDRTPVAAERWYQIFTFEAREATKSEFAPWASALNLGADGRRQLGGRQLSSYRDELEMTRRLTLGALAERDDSWLEASLHVAPEMNAHWAWFHVAEDEINHRGQIRWLRARLGSALDGQAAVR